MVTSNEMALHYKHRRDFPLHFRVFEQVSSHMCHEGNAVAIPSASSHLRATCPMTTARKCPENLATWTSAVGANMGIYQPSVDQVMKRYFMLFSHGGCTQTHATGTAPPDA